MDSTLSRFNLATIVSGTLISLDTRFEQIGGANVDFVQVDQQVLILFYKLLVFCTFVPLFIEKVRELCHFLIRFLFNPKNLVNPQADVFCNMFAFKRFTHHSDKVKDVKGPLGEIDGVDAVIKLCLRKCF